MFYRMRRIRILLCFILVINLTACVPKGSILITEKQDGSGFTMDFNEWSSKDKCKLELNKDDVIQIEIEHEEGNIGLEVTGNKGSEPYEGHKLESRKFTVTISETDTYVFSINGKNATGKIIVTKVNG